MFLPLNKTWNVLDRTKAVSFALHQDSVNPLIPGVFPGSTAMPQRQPLPGDYSGAVYIQRLTTTEVTGTVFGVSKRWKDGWGIFSDGRWFVILLSKGSFSYPLRI